jgi:hypothetical protein
MLEIRNSGYEAPRCFQCVKKEERGEIRNSGYETERGGGMFLKRGNARLVRSA